MLHYRKPLQENLRQFRNSKTLFSLKKLTKSTIKGTKKSFLERKKHEK